MLVQPVARTEPRVDCDGAGVVVHDGLGILVAFFKITHYFLRAIGIVDLKIDLLKRCGLPVSS